MERVPASVFTSLGVAQGAAREFVRDHMAESGGLVVARLGPLDRYIVVTVAEFDRFADALDWRLM